MTSGVELSYNSNRSWDSGVLGRQPAVRKILDPVHHFIEFQQLYWDIIDTPQFQRLRNVKQLGASSLVFPGATHSRFEHSLGTGYLAHKYVCFLKNNSPHLLYSEDLPEVQMSTTIAGLCHDLGHGPFSHMFDNVVIPSLMGLPKAECGWSHEDASGMLLDALVEENGIELEERVLRQAKDQIAGTGRGWRFQIVSNSRTSLDVDKYDYFKRDSLYLGVKNILVDHQLIMKESKVCEDRICYPVKYAEKIFDVYQSRYKLFKNYYTNRKVLGIELMVADALIAADRVYNFREAITSPERYLRLSDSILHEIQFSEDPLLANSKKIVEDIVKRRLYKYVAEITLPGEFKLPCEERILADIVSSARADGLRTLAPADIRVAVGNLNYSFRDRNPMDEVPFYSQNRDRSFFVTKKDVSMLYSDDYSEIFLRLYLRSQNAELFQLAKEAFRTYVRTLLPGKEIGLVEGRLPSTSFQ